MTDELEHIGDAFDKPTFLQPLQCDGEHYICAKNLSDNVREFFVDMINAGVLVTPEGHVVPCPNISHDDLR